MKFIVTLKLEYRDSNNIPESHVHNKNSTKNKVKQSCWEEGRYEELTFL